MAETRVEKAESGLAAAESKQEELESQLSEAQTSTQRATDLKRLAQLKSDSSSHDTDQLNL